MIEGNIKEIKQYADIKSKIETRLAELSKAPRLREQATDKDAIERKYKADVKARQLLGQRNDVAFRGLGVDNIKMIRASDLRAQARRLEEQNKMSEAASKRREAEQLENEVKRDRERMREESRKRK